MVASRVRTFLLVTFFSVVIWLFAEGESLKQDEVSTRVVFESGATSSYVMPEGEWNGSVRIALKGTTDAIDEARRLLAGEVVLTAGLGRVPGEGGVHTINLLDALQEQERIRRSGVTLESVNPAQATIRVREVLREPLRVSIDLPGVEVEGQASASPSEVRVGVPKDLKEALASEGKWPLQVIATVPTERLAGLRAGASVDRQADLVLPEELLGDPAVAPPTTRVNITFTVKARLEREELRAVPVWLLLPTAQAGEWDIAIEAGAELIGVTVEGPLAQVERLRSREDKLVAVVQLTIDDLTQRVQSKPLGFALLRGGSTLPLPSTMRVTPERTSVPLTITSVGEAG